MAISNAISAVGRYNLIPEGGTITLTAGMAGVNPGPNSSLWAALNGGLIAYTKALAVDFSKRIRVNVIVPGLVKTELWERIIPNQHEREAFFKMCLKRNLVPSIAEPEDIWEGFRFCIISNQLTGREVVMDGGSLLTGNLSPRLGPRL